MHLVQRDSKIHNLHLEYLIKHGNCKVKRSRAVVKGQGVLNPYSIFYLSYEMHVKLFP